MKNSRSIRAKLAFPAISGRLQGAPGNACSWEKFHFSQWFNSAGKAILIKKDYFNQKSNLFYTHKKFFLFLFSL